jgi:hypothetical protein
MKDRFPGPVKHGSLALRPLAHLPLYLLARFHHKLARLLARLRPADDDGYHPMQSTRPCPIQPSSTLTCFKLDLSSRSHQPLRVPPDIP